MSLQELGISEQYSFEIIVLDLKAIKCNYEGILSSFLPFQYHERLICHKQIHDLFYSLNLEVWKIDRIWEYLNGDITYEILEDILNRQKCKKMV